MKTGGEVLIGKVWPNEAAYPDWSAPSSEAYWGAQLTQFQKTVAFDGLW